MEFLKPLMPFGVGLAVVLVALWCLKQFLGESFKELGKRFATWLMGGNRTLGRRRQNRYRKHLLSNTSKHPLGFLRDQTIQIDRIYVPLQMTDNGRRVDVYKEIRGRNPGSNSGRCRGREVNALEVFGLSVGQRTTARCPTTDPSRTSPIQRRGVHPNLTSRGSSCAEWPSRYTIHVGESIGGWKDQLTARRPR